MMYGGIKMEKNIVEEIVKERIKENKALFNNREYNILEENINLAKKSVHIRIYKC